MDIIVEDGTGIVIANSYLSVDKADELLSINIHSKWAALDEDTKERLLMFATRKLDERVKWYGHKFQPTSGLAWPRCGVRDKEGFPVDDNLVPLAVQIATATLADHLITGDPDTVNTASNLTALQVDVIELKFDSKITPEKYPIEIKYLLAGLGTVSMGRGGPKFIVKY